MKSTGIVRGIDELGRIVLPKELRTTLGLAPNSKLEIFVEGDTILLKKYRPAGVCALCGGLDDDSVIYQGHCICGACRKKLSAL